VVGQTVADQSDAAGIFIALGDTIRRFELDPQLFEDLLSAFRQDVHTNRYQTWDELLDYCRRSANPVAAWSCAFPDIARIDWIAGPMRCARACSS
jgi:phytoene/squalene synthetase